VESWSIYIYVRRGLVRRALEAVIGRIVIAIAVSVSRIGVNRVAARSHHPAVFA
jgi:hypothetical protein